MEPKQKATFGLSVCFALWFALLIVASALYSDWVLLFNLMFLVFLPVPVIIGGLGKNSGGEAEVTWAAFGSCLAAFVLVALFAYPLVLWHTGNIHVDAFLVVMAANAILFGGGGYFVKMYSAEDDDYSAF